jgi:putative DNA primase/helicase
MADEDIPPAELDEGLDQVLDNVVSIDAQPKRKRKPRASLVVPRGEGWETKLLWKSSASGLTLETNLANAATILANAPEFEGAIAFDEFAGRPTILKPCPIEAVPGPWRNIHQVRAAAWLQGSKWRLNVGADTASLASTLVAHSNPVHPLRQKLSSLEWDGTGRIASWLTTYLGADPTPYHAEIGAKWLISMIARAFVPGCKVDHVIVLEGKQAAMKSTALRHLSLGWFADDIPDLGTKDSAIHLQGVWLVEMAELDALCRSDLNRIKAFVTRTIDRYRAVYQEHAEDHPRQCVFSGSTNEQDYLTDPSGGRRWWPVPVGTIQIADLERDVLQLWAEARLAHEDGKEWWISSETAHKRAAEVQEERYSGDVWDERIAEFVTGLAWVTVPMILGTSLQLSPREQDRTHQMRVTKCLKSLGWRRTRVYEGGGRSWRYLPPQPPPPPQPREEVGAVVIPQ